MEFKIVILVQFISIALLAVVSAYIFQKWKAKQHSFLFLYSASILIEALYNSYGEL